MERTPVTAPLACFSREHDARDATCQACAYAADCARYMGRRGDPRLSTLRFKLMPELLEVRLPDPELTALQPLYASCYFSVFESAAPDRLDRRSDAAKILAKSCAEAKCSLRMFMLASMMGHKSCAPARKFYANMLLGPAAIQRAVLYRGVCSKAFGTFDLQALTAITQNNSSLEARLLNSEIIAGAWITGYKMRYGGAYGTSFYAANEIALDPYWLAVEPSYVNLVLAPQRDTPTDIAELRRHRFNTSRVLTDLKRHRDKARAVFGLREKIAPAALKAVLTRLGCSVEDFTTREPVVTDLFKFWGQLAHALKTYMLMRFIQGDRAALERVRG